MSLCAEFSRESHPGKEGICAAAAAFRGFDPTVVARPGAQENPPTDWTAGRFQTRADGAFSNGVLLLFLGFCCFSETDGARRMRTERGATLMVTKMP